MGFDDSLFDGDVQEKVLDALIEEGSLTYYVEETFGPKMTTAQLVHNEKETMYNGYSLAFHMIHPIVKVFQMGCVPEWDALYEQAAWLTTRKVVLTHVLKHGAFKDDAFEESVREQIALTHTMIEQNREQIRERWMRTHYGKP